MSEVNHSSVTRERREDLGSPSPKLPALYTKQHSKFEGDHWLTRWLNGKESNAGDAGDKGSFTGLGRFSGGGNGTHSSILAWKIPWTGKPDGPQSMWSQRVGYD